MNVIGAVRIQYAHRLYTIFVDNLCVYLWYIFYLREQDYVVQGRPVTNPPTFGLSSAPGTLPL